jgi:hypothetical protein
VPALALSVAAFAALVWFRREPTPAEATAEPEPERKQAASSVPPLPSGALPEAPPEARETLARQLRMHRETSAIKRAIGRAKTDADQQALRKELERTRALHREDERLTNERPNATAVRKRAIDVRLAELARERERNIERHKTPEERACKCADDDPLCSCL